MLLPLVAPLASLTTSTFSEPPSTISRSLITLLNSNLGMVSIPLTLTSTDYFYQAVFTDALGNTVAGQIDYLQQNVWLMNGEKMLDCLVVDSYTNSLANGLSSASIPSSISYDSTTWNLNYCHSNGAIYPNEVITTTDGTQVLTYTSLYYEVLQPLSLSYGDVTYASGDYVSGNLNISAANGSQIELESFNFLMANWSHLFTGGLGLCGAEIGQNTGQGLINFMLSKHMIMGNGYSIYYAPRANGNNGDGVVILGGVDVNYFNGDFYAFPKVTHTMPDSLFYPIVVVDLSSIENLATGDIARLYFDASFPVLLDSRLQYSYLPSIFIFNLAIQTNAFYSNQNNRWIVRCADVWGTDAVISFSIGPLKINIPLQSLISPVTHLSYSNGDAACFLTVLPLSFLGYAAFGLNVLTHVYMAMDNTKGTIALANANKNILFKKGNAIVNGTRVRKNRASAGPIMLGYIPFATHVSLQTPVVFSFLQANASVETNIPARFSGSLFESNLLYISDNFQSNSGISRYQNKSESSANKLNAFYPRPKLTEVAGLLLLATLGLIVILIL